MKEPDVPRQPACIVRVGAMERPRDVQPGLVPVQIVDPAGDSPIEADFPLTIVEAAEVQAAKRGITCEEYMAGVILAAVR